ncbi:hypothetical protein [uncultured Erythrobacter sp.]|uniref:hypothetical protein n=1 Tax=uncultured Erythrobacter sp. TaxID=263913 RepID=UPI002635B49B|nr:hypothetical protein [uncultured Erythrobacter sp.]
MRTALLAALKRTESGEIRALMPLAGRSALGWQMDLVRDLGCERIICLCDIPGPEILGLQQECEARGNEFHAVRGIPQLLALLRAEDELVVLMDGLVIDRATSAELFPSIEKLPKTVFSREPNESVPRESISEDFERIDAERRWAGMLVMRADRAQQLGDMPSDSDAVSLLLRIALQSGSSAVTIPEPAFEDGRLFLAESAEAVEQKHRQIITASAPPLVWNGPAGALAVLVGRQLELAGVKSAVVLSAALSALFFLTGILLSWNGYGVAGLALSALGAFSGACASALLELRSRLFGHDRKVGAILTIKTATIVGAIAATLGALSPAVGQTELIVLPVFAFGLIVLASADGSPQVRAFWSDHATQLTLLAGFAALGYPEDTLATLGLVALAHKLLRLRRN